MCPQVTEDGICTGQIVTYTELREKKSILKPALSQKKKGPQQKNDEDGEQEEEWEQWEDAAGKRSLTLICRNVPPSFQADQVGMYFWQYGQVLECVKSEEDDGYLVTFSNEETIQEIFGASPHSLDGFNRLEIVRKPLKRLAEAEKDMALSSSSPGKAGHHHRIFVGRLPDQVSRSLSSSFATARSFSLSRVRACNVVFAVTSLAHYFCRSVLTVLMFFTLHAFHEVRIETCCCHASEEEL